MRRILTSILLALGLAGCAATSNVDTASSDTQSSTSSIEAASVSTTAAASAASKHAAPRRPAPVRRPRHHKPKPKPPAAAGALPISYASAQQVQPQPAPGSCHVTGQGELVMPDPHCTPGALNPAVTQASINQTICVPGYTKTIRPPESITEPEKLASMAAYGYGGQSPSGFEYDHLVSLELGGAANDPRNLWPETGASPNPKDSVENTLHDLVCSGQMSLTQAQHIIATDWLGWAKSHGATGNSTPAAPTSHTPAPAPSAGSSGCSATASYSSRYGDWDVYVHSGQPGQTVTVSDTSGRTATWHTDSSGYADVYFKAPSGAAGETVTVQVGGASCQTRL